MPTILTNETNVDWLPKPNHVEFTLDSALPDASSIDGIYAFAFHEQRLLLVLHTGRGWDLPGADGAVLGAPAAALERAVRQSAGAQLEGVRPLGYFRLQRPEQSRPSYVLLFVAHVQELERFSPSGDLRERTFVAAAEADQIEFLRQYAAVYQAALEWARKTGD